MTAIYNFVITSDYTQFLYLADDTNFTFMVFLYGFIGSLFSFSIASTVAIGGPLALNITGILKDVFLTYAGFIFFDDVEATSYVLVGLALSFAGAIKCVHSKSKSSKTDKAKTVDIEKTKKSK